jgi:hypothetical protein
VSAGALAPTSRQVVRAEVRRVSRETNGPNDPNASVATIQGQTLRPVARASCHIQTMASVGAMNPALRGAGSIRFGGTRFNYLAGSARTSMLAGAGRDQKTA